MGNWQFQNHIRHVYSKFWQKQYHLEMVKCKLKLRLQYQWYWLYVAEVLQVLIDTSELRVRLAPLNRF